MSIYPPTDRPTTPLTPKRGRRKKKKFPCKAASTTTTTTTITTKKGDRDREREGERKRRLHECIAPSLAEFMIFIHLSFIFSLPVFIPFGREPHPLI
jgi:hypothetical protein